MGYSYFFSCSTTTKLSKEQFLRVKRAYDNVKTRDWFPAFNQTEISGSGGYGVGSASVAGMVCDEAERWKEDTNPINELLLFTSQVPDVTFMIIYTFWDETNIKIYKIRDRTVLNVWQAATEEDGFVLEGFKIGFAMTDVRGDNNLDEYLTEGVEYEE